MDDGKVIGVSNMIGRDPQNIADQSDPFDRREILKGMSAAALAGYGLFEPAYGKDVATEARAASNAIDESQGLTWLPAWRLRDMIVKGEVSSAEVVRHFIGRIEEHDSRLHAFRKLDVPAALAQAQRADEAVKAGETLGALHGVPMAIKELMTVKGFPVPGSYFNYMTGERRAEPPIAARDDIEVERLRTAGAIIVGVTVAAGGAGPGSPNPASLPRNPWDISRTAGVSSAGNAAAVGAGLLPMALGDDGAGSVRIPAAFCGLVGLHPTRGRIPHVDHKSAAPRPTVMVGPMTRNVRDAAVALQVLAGPDGRDFVCLQDQPPDYVAALDSGIGGKRFLWTYDFGFTVMPENLQSPRNLFTVHAAAQTLQKAGGIVTEAVTTWENPMLSWLAAQQLMSGAIAPALAERDLTEQEVSVGLECRRRNWQRFQKIFSEYDFVISPTVQIIAPKMDAWLELWTQWGGNPKRGLALEFLAAHLAMCNVLGIPAISIPAGFVDGLPVGLQVIGRPGSEAQLLQVAQAFLAARRRSGTA
jgi:aspartyl-tRNA(Asn)/glutamyl-tRNA(Gln) amidotransferase subunit A